MKKLFVAISVIGLLALTSCGSGGGLGAGSWSFKGITYNAITGIGSTTAKTLTASTGSTSEVDDVVFHFASYPPAAGTYTIVGSASASSLTATQVYIIMNIGTKAYTIDASGSSSATVTVSGGKVSVSVPLATFSTLSSGDSGPFTASINQNL